MTPELIITRQDKVLIAWMIVQEWILCLVSPRHAAKTWLRIDPKVEEKYIIYLKRAVIGLFVAVAFVAGMAVGELRMLHHINAQQQQPIKIQVQRTISV